MSTRSLAAKVKQASDVALPHLEYWNYDACEYHDEPRPDCEYRACGGDLFSHQRVGVTWLYIVEKGILADMTGLGKTNQIIGLCALLKEKGELTRRAVVVCQASAVVQWAREFNRFAPRLNVITATGTKPQRIQSYISNWDVCIIGYQMFLRDRAAIEELEPGLLVEDDVDPIRNHANRTTQAYNRVSRQADRVININATPLQVRLEELYSTSVSVGGFDIFGSHRAFQRRYIRQEPVMFYTKGGRKHQKWETAGYKNMEDFKAKFGPLYLRRRYEDMTDVRIPDIMPPEDVWLDMHPAQRLKYEELQDGVLRLLKEDVESIKHVEAFAKVTHGAQICAGLPALGEADGPEASIKLDWLLDKLTGDWSNGEKLVVFSRFKGTIRALYGRLSDAGIGMAAVWGENRRTREAEVERFWDDPNTRVCVGTSAIERSLNLQVANIVINLDTLLNPARMMQILGRVRRVGSTHSHVYVFNLLCRDTQEERYMDVLEKRQALADYVWGESNDLYEALSPIELLHLIRP